MADSSVTAFAFSRHVSEIHGYPPTELDLNLIWAAIFPPIVAAWRHTAGKDRKNFMLTRQRLDRTDG